MLKRGLHAAIFFAALCTTAWAAPSVSRHAFARGVADKEPVGVADVFPAGVGSLYFFTHIVGAKPPVEILHVWIYDGQEVAIYPITVEGPSWRTWSVRGIRPEQAGDWTVEVRDVDGNVILSAGCRIE